MHNTTDHTSINLWDNANVSGDGAVIQRSHFITRAWHPAMIAIFHLLAISGIPGNLVVIIAYIKWPVLRTSTSTLVVVNQCVADLLACMVVMPIPWFNFTAEGSAFIGKHKTLCLLSLFAGSTTVVCSSFNIFVISVERFICVVMPYRYYQWVSIQSVKKWLAVLWTVVFLSTCPPLLGWHNFHYGAGCSPATVYPKSYSAAFFLIPNLVLAILSSLLNVIICAVAYRMRNQIADEMVAQNGEDQHRNVTKADLKIMKMFRLVVGAYFATWLPFTVIFLILSTQPAWLKRGVPEWLFLLYDIARVLVVVNPAVNSAIYAFKNKDIREALLKMLRSQDSTSTSN